ncbi:MAG TPA: PaaX family transcriptional regulator C-terminal domain-containing protein [Acidimicrobiales bacterium]
MGETTVAPSTGTPTGGPRGTPPSDTPWAISGGDLPTRLLVLGMAHEDGTIRADEVFPVAEACARSPEQVRSCLRRLVAEGLFVREGVGQSAVYRATEDGLAALGASAERTRLAHVQDRAGRAWDGSWHLAAFAIPEARRPARDALRDHLGGLGGAPVHNGLYVSPHAWEKDVTAEAERLGVAEHLTLAATRTLTVGGVREPTALARRLWPLDELAARYRDFLDRWSHVPEGLAQLRRARQPLPDSAFLPGALAMGVAYAACFEADPLLPPELLPQPWPGRAARDLMVRSRRLALEIRAEHDRPPLFRAYDDVIAALP